MEDKLYLPIRDLRFKGRVNQVRILDCVVSLGENTNSCERVYYLFRSLLKAPASPSHQFHFSEPYLSPVFLMCSYFLLKMSYYPIKCHLRKRNLCWTILSRCHRLTFSNKIVYSFSEDSLVLANSVDPV